MARYMVLDLETENHQVNHRFASPFSDKNWVVARGWKFKGDKQCSFSYHPENEKTYATIPSDITLIVGHNLKFDLLYEWKGKDLQAFFKRGGYIWDTQYAEYLLNAQHVDSHMVAMDDIAEKYGGRKKIDAVKALWEMGMLTSQIDKGMLIDYLVGTEEEGRDSGDIGNTEKIFLGQIKRAIELGMMPMIRARMDGLLALTMMEFNGLHISVQEGARRAKELEAELQEADAELNTYLPEFPDGFTFNWNSTAHKSALIFGGTVKYEKTAPYIDESTGEYARTKATAKWPLFNNEPLNPELTGVDPFGLHFYEVDHEECRAVYQDKYTSGAKKGTGKFRSVDVPGEIKTKKQVFTFSMPGYTTPDPNWKLADTDAIGAPLYSTDADTIEELATRDIPFLKALGRRTGIVKDLGTYYVRYDPKTKEYTGMLTCVSPDTHLIHHTLNPVNTVTSRLSSSKPNLQNVPRGDTSEVKKMFTSRFAQGIMLEADYKQLEVVVQGLLSGDANLCQDLRNKIDFHCKRVSAKMGISYEEAVYRCTDKTYEHHKEWKKIRTGVKEFSFQRAYGAGAAAIAASTGLPIDDVKALIEAEDAMYPGVAVFNAKVEAAINASAVPFKDASRGWRTFRRGYWQSPTGTRYTWRSYDAPKFLKERGIEDSFAPPEIKNYPIQGTGGEIVQIILGRLFRKFIETDNYGGKALLCNTVHDCIWIDTVPDVLDQVGPDVKRIMESVPEALNTLYGMEVNVPFPVELEIGPDLYSKTEYHP